jgi:hypothetical protein
MTGYAIMHLSNVHTTRLKILTLYFIEGDISMKYFVSMVEFYMNASRTKAIRKTSPNYQKDP